MHYLHAAEEREQMHDTALQLEKLKLLTETNYQHWCFESDEILWHVDQVMYQECHLQFRTTYSYYCSNEIS